jgi:hypothetical protein
MMLTSKDIQTAVEQAAGVTDPKPSDSRMTISGFVVSDKVFPVIM